jgi:hypothetical protein
MLYDIPSLKRITSVPFQSEYRAWRTALDGVDPQAYSRIHTELTSKFSGSEIKTSSWIPGSTWQGTPWFPIYLATGQDENQAAMFFGLLVWQVVMDLPDCWGSGKYELNGISIKGRTYFTIDCP